MSNQDAPSLPPPGPNAKIFASLSKQAQQQLQMQQMQQMLQTQQMQQMLQTQQGQLVGTSFSAGGIFGGAAVQAPPKPLKPLLPPASAVQHLPPDCRVELWQVVVINPSGAYGAQPAYDVKAVALVLNPPFEDYKPGEDNTMVMNDEMRLLFSTEAKAREWVQAAVRTTFRKKAEALVAELVQAGLERGLLADADLDVADALRKYAGGDR